MDNIYVGHYYGVWIKLPDFYLRIDNFVNKKKRSVSNTLNLFPQKLQ